VVAACYTVDTGYHRVLQGDGGSNNWLIGYFNDGVDKNCYYNGNFIYGDPTSTDWYYATLINISGSGAELRWNGDSVGSNVGTGGPGTILSLGSNAYTANNPGDTYIAELIVFDSTLSPANILIVEAYLRTKYGLS
jgi:hypothetical protein